MKKVTVFILMLCVLISAVPVLASAEDRAEFYVTYSVNEVNKERTANAINVYTPEFGETTKTTGVGVEYVVNASNIITAIGKNNSKIPADGYVISVGPAKRTQMEPLKIGDIAYYDNAYDTVTFISKDYNPFVSETIPYDGINVTRAENKLIIYRYKPTTGTNTWGYEAVVDETGTIISVGGNNNDIPENGFVISAVGNRKTEVQNFCKLGYSAVIDTENKVISVSYTKENALKYYQLCLDQVREDYNVSKQAFLDIDYALAEESDKKLADILNDIENALSNDNVKEFLCIAGAFECELKKYENALIPYAPVETRALWLRIPTSNAQSTVERVVNDIKTMGFNSVCIELLFDSTTIMPMPEVSLFEQNPIFKGTDMLKLYIDEFHKNGIEVHGWMSCYRVGHDGSVNVERSVAKKKPEWLNVDQNGKTNVTNEYGSAYFLNPALSEVQEFLLENYRYILENYEIDGFQLDYVRYPENSTVNFGYDEYTKSEFLKVYDYQNVPTGSGQNGWKEWCQFRASFVTKLVKDTRALIDEIRPDVLFSCDVAPDYATSITKMCQDTTTWLKEGIVDIVYPMAYGTTDAVIKWTNNTIANSTDKTQIVVGLRDNGAETYREQIIASRDCGAEGTAFFSYSQYVGADYSLIGETIFSKPAICPSFNAKKAILAQLQHISETYEQRICQIDFSEYDIDINLSEAEAFSNKAKELYQKLESSDVKTLSSEILSFVEEGRAVAEKYNSDAYSQGISNYISNSVRIIEKTAVNSRDEFKKDYTADEEIADVSQDESIVTNNEDEYTTTAFEKVFQVFFIIIMSVGVLGLPLYYYLNSRKSRSENNSDDSDCPDDSSEDNNTENDTEKEETDEQ